MGFASHRPALAVAVDSCWLQEQFRPGIAVKNIVQHPSIHIMGCIPCSIFI